MEEFTIDLEEVVDSGGSYRSRDEKGKRFPKVLVDSGNKTQVKAKLMIAVHGTLEPNSDPTSLLIFEFYLTTPNGRRFKKSTITITFEDDKGPSEFDPEVYQISPEGKFTLNKQTDSEDITHAVDAAVNGVPVTGGSLGYHWTMSRTVNREHSATLNGMSRKIKTYGEETSAVWVMEEDPVKGEGVPTFLRAAVLLRHEESEKFRFSVEIDTAENKLFYGSSTSKMVNPLSIDPNIIASVKKKGVDPTNLGSVDLGSEYLVKLATALTI
jgi:hypothetical protein